MPAFLIRHPGKASDDILVEDPALTLHFEHGWAVFTDTAGTCLAIPAEAGAHIERVDEPQDHEPAPQKE
ncbi:hypothetical protein [Streptomyces anulatus]|uniref:hypothetical protein n=1 Tax=Streptomyces anulatus TaxID=1892 RepID=UPI002ED4E00B|nr:hypothetical protein OG703_33830 [Streptomyces anulatus]